MPRHRSHPEFLDPTHDHAPCLADTLERAEQVFAHRGLRLTPLRRQVLQEIAGSHTAVGAYDLLDRLARKSGRRLAPISVYRALDSLLEAGMVHRLESRNAFFACHTPHGAGLKQVILACEGCGTVAEVQGEAIFDGIASVARQAEFAPARMLVEVSGTCAACSGAAG